MSVSPVLEREARSARAPATSEFNLLLVSRCSEWSEAVRCATAELGGGDVQTCGARDALARLAGGAPNYSHLLVDRNDAEGLLDELADLAIEMAAPDTDLVVLGSTDRLRLELAKPRHPRIRFVATATSRSVVEALMANSPPHDGPAIGPAELTTALQHAMIENRYQPIVSIANRRPVGLEALARLNHPQRGPLTPDRFIPQLEDAGLGGALTELVSARALADLAGPLLAHRELRMSVNFPLDVLLQPAALSRLEEQRLTAGVAANNIVIELTESRPVDDFEMLRRSLEWLRRLGYGASIDDVGPAVPRLAPLLELPFTSLKLDKEIVQRAGDCDQIRRFVADTVRRAQARNMIVVAEGVETEATWEQMRELGVDEVQGFLAARPLPVAAVPVWWDAWIA